MTTSESIECDVYAVTASGGRYDVYCRACSRRVGIIDEAPELDAPWLPYWWPHHPHGASVPLSPRSEWAQALVMLERAHRAEGCTTVREARGATTASKHAEDAHEAPTRDLMLERAAMHACAAAYPSGDSPAFAWSSKAGPSDRARFRAAARAAVEVAEAWFDGRRAS